MVVSVVVAVVVEESAGRVVTSAEVVSAVAVDASPVPSGVEVPNGSVVATSSAVPMQAPSSGPSEARAKARRSTSGG